LPGAVLVGLGVLGLVKLPAEIVKVRSGEIGRSRLVLLAVADLGLIIVGFLMYFGKL